MLYQVFWHETEYFVALNTEVILSLNELRDERNERSRIQLSTLFSEDGDASENAFDRLERFVFRDQPVLALSDPQTIDRDLRAGLVEPRHAAPPPAWMQKRTYCYYRFSPRPTNPRVDKKTGCFLPGTFATTDVDYRHVPSGFAAVGRYALPVPASARFVFQITTNQSPTYMRAAVPLFGQAGGGVEVFFQSGAKKLPANSDRIPVG